MFVLAYINFAIIAVLGCVKEVLLTPDTISSFDYSSRFPSSMLMDPNPTTYWMGKYYIERVTYSFSTPIYVTGIFVHNYGSDLYELGASGNVSFGSERDVGAYSSRNWKVNNVYATRVYFYFTTTSAYNPPRISAAWVYGCYVTSTPTRFPTTAGPTNFPTMNLIQPSISPTVSPTPLSAQPSQSPTLSPSISPTVSPTSFSAEPTERPTVSEDVGGFSLVQLQTSLIVAGGVGFIYCVGLICLFWVVQRRKRRHEQVVNLLMSEKCAMDKIKRTPNIKDESYSMEGRVRNETPGNIQLINVRSISGEDAYSDL